MANRIITGSSNPPFNRNLIRRCFTTEHMNMLIEKDPALATRLARFERRTDAKIAQQNAVTRNQFRADSIKTIPLVVHVVYNTEWENISDAQIRSQIDILNQDFSRTNPDASNTPSVFEPVATDTGIRFCLVKVIRKKTNRTGFDFNNDVKFTSKGGSDAVDTSSYLNVWVCNLQGALGYGEFPSSTLTPTYGVVMLHEAFGTGGTTRAPYNRGRTLTHEIAHSLSVYHIFDEETHSCTKTDKCPDIPAQSSPTGGCPSFPQLDNCSLNPPGIMFMNYMDYSDDACMNIFTKDQAKRMNATLETYPYNNLAKTGCDPLGDTVPAPLPLIPPLPVVGKVDWRILLAIGLILILIFWATTNKQ